MTKNRMSLDLKEKLSWITIIEQKTLYNTGIGNSAPIKRKKEAWLKKYGRRCLFCKRDMLFHVRNRFHGRFATLDHINARCLGGEHRNKNIQVICSDCNSVKAVEEEKLVLEIRNKK